MITSLIPEPGTRRIYALSVLVKTFGIGMIATAMPLYATRMVHLSAARAGLGLTIAGLIGAAAGIPIGDLADRRGPRGTAQAVMLVQAVAAICYLFVRNFADFTVVATLDTLSMSASLSADAGSLLRRVGGEDATEFRARIQAILNLGLSLGVVLCGAAIQIGTPTAYHSLFLANALTFLIASAILKRLPRYEPLPKPGGSPRWAALADKPFVAYTTLSGAMFVEFFVLIYLLPLWIVDHTQAPRWSISLLFFTNTSLIVLFQIRVGRNVKTLRQGGTALRRAGLIFLFSCSAMGLATGIPDWAALLVLVAAVALHTCGELLHSSASYALGFGMAPEHAQGQYQGLAGIGTGLGQAAAPVLLIGVCLSLGWAGFCALGALLALLASGAPAIARWGERTRHATGSTPQVGLGMAESAK
jgi:MFS family permease